MSKSTSLTNYIIALLTIYVIEFTSAVGSSLVANVLGKSWLKTLGAQWMLYKVPQQLKHTAFPCSKCVVTYESFMGLHITSCSAFRRGKDDQKISNKHTLSHKFVFATVSTF